MKISLSWIRDFLDLDKQTSEIADILTSLGLEVEGWDEVKPSAADLDMVFTGLVTECAPIPDTDHLSATQVDLGDGDLRSIVCGAPNVAAGQKVLVAVPGARVFSKDGALFTIGERKVRGVLSQGMICAEDELGIGHDHAGIMVLPPETKTGIRASEYLQKTGDTVIEIGLTPNRADATNHLGIARDLAAYLRARENQPAPIRMPEAPPLQPVSGDFRVSVENPEACKRYSGVLLRGVRVQESPEWLQQRLLAVGQRPINNIVDITNYVRIELGQPLHAFDAQAIKGRHIRVKTLPAGTVFKTLDEQDRALAADDLMICDAESSPLCMGGVFGGADSGVTEATTEVFLESACFDSGWIRRSMIRHGLRTDAAWMFEKGVDPNGSLFALQRAVQLIVELAGGAVASDVFDVYPEKVAQKEVSLRYARINALIGISIEPARVRQILEALDMGIEHENAEGLSVRVPTNKPEVLREADIIEEILRIYGLDNVPAPNSMRTSMEITPKPNPESVRNMLSDLLAANGFFEAMSLSLSNSDYYTGEAAIFPIPTETLAYVHNTANQGLDCMRPTLLFGGLEAIRHNQNRRHPDLRLFEIGKTYRREQQGEKTIFPETQQLALFLTGARQPESWQPAGKEKTDFYTLKPYVVQILARLGISGYQETVLQPGEHQAFQYGVRLHRGPQELAVFGQVSPAVCKMMDIKNAVFVADLNLDNLLVAHGANRVQYQELSKFPTVRRDLALVLDRRVPFGEVRQLALKTAKKILKEVNLFDVFEDESKLGPGKKSYAVSFLFENPTKTLEDKEIDALMQDLQKAFETKLSALVRGG